jgi:exonuclease VII large subunit
MQTLASCEQLAATLDPHAVLARGYAMLRQGGIPVAAAKLQPGEAVTLETGELWIDCTVDTVRRKDEA